MLLPRLFRTGHSRQLFRPTPESTMTDSSSAPAPQPQPPARPKAALTRYALVMALVAFAAWVFDQLTKIWVVATMTEGQVTDVLPPLLRWHFIRNPGAAFSIGTDYTWIFTIIMVLVSGFLIYLMFRLRSAAWSVALGLVLGGAVGNLTDRLFREPSFGQGQWWTSSLSPTLPSSTSRIPALSRASSWCAC